MHVSILPMHAAGDMGLWPLAQDNAWGPGPDLPRNALHESSLQARTSADPRAARPSAVLVQDGDGLHVLDAITGGVLYSRNSEAMRPQRLRAVHVPGLDQVVVADSCQPFLLPLSSSGPPLPWKRL